MKARWIVLMVLSVELQIWSLMTPRHQAVKNLFSDPGLHLAGSRDKNRNTRNMPFKHRDDLTRPHSLPADSLSWDIFSREIFLLHCKYKWHLVALCLSQVHRGHDDDDSDLYSFDYLVSCRLMTCHWSAAVLQCCTSCSVVQLNFLLPAKHREIKRR